MLHCTCSRLTHPSPVRYGEQLGRDFFWVSLSCTSVSPLAMALLQLYRLQILWTILFLLTLTVFIGDARRGKRPLLRAHERERVADTYFVHFRKDVQEEKLQELVQQLSNRSIQGGSFRASVSSIVTRVAYGFSARMSQEALNYVSTWPINTFQVLFTLTLSFFNTCIYKYTYIYYVSMHGKDNT